MILIESPDGSEKQLVEKLEGYAGWKVLGRGVECPPDDHDWCKKDKCFKPNEARLRARSRQALGRDPEALLARLDELENRMATLERMLNAGGTLP